MKATYALCIGLLLMAGTAAASPTWQADVAIIGAGPTGATAALELAARGARVLVLEQREDIAVRQRPRYRMVALDEATLGILSGHVPVRTFANEMGSVELRSPDPRYATSIPIEPLPANPVRPTAEQIDSMSHLGGFRRSLVATAETNDLERALGDRMRADPRIRVVYQDDVRGLSVGRDAVTIEHQAAGSAVRREQVRYLAIADGARSSERGAMHLLGIGSTRLGGRSTILFARFRNSGERPGLAAARIEPGDPELPHGLAFASSQYVQVGVPVARGVDPNDRAQVRRLIVRAATEMGVTGALLEEPVVVHAEAEEAESLVFQDRVFVLGDAAMHASSLQGVFMNVGIHDGARFADLWSRMRSLSTRSPEAAALRQRFVDSRRRLNRDLTTREVLLTSLAGRSLGALGNTRLAREAAMQIFEGGTRLTATSHTPALRHHVTNSLRIGSRVQQGIADSPVVQLLPGAGAAWSIGARLWDGLARAHDQSTRPQRRSPVRSGRPKLPGRRR